MKLPALAYERPLTVEGASELLAEPGAVALAGGQSLVPALVLQELTAALLVDLGAIADMQGIEVRDGVLSVGAMVPMWDVERDADVRRVAPVLVDVLATVGASPIRSRATLAGSIVWRDPVSQLPGALAALGAVVVTTLRRVSAAELIQSDGLAAGELVLRVEIPDRPRRSGFELVRRTHITWPVAGACVCVDDLGAHVALHGAGPRHVVATRETVADALETALERSEPIDDTRASARYRTRVLPALARRAMERAERTAR